LTNWPDLTFVTSFSRAGEYPGPTMNDLFSDNVDEIEETKENDGVGDWIAVDSNPLMAPQESNKYGTLTIAGVDNAEFPNMQYVEIKEDTTIFPVNGPVAEESGG